MKERFRHKQDCISKMNRLSHYHDPISAPPPIPRKGILMSPPRPAGGLPPPQVQTIHQAITNQRLTQQAQLASISEFSGPMSLPWGGSVPTGPSQRINFNTQQNASISEDTVNKRVNTGGNKVWNSSGAFGSLNSSINIVNSEQPSSILSGGSGDRIKPDKQARKVIQKFQFSADTDSGIESGGKRKESRLGFRQRTIKEEDEDGMDSVKQGGRRQLASLSIADISPRLALQRILVLFERGEQREAAAFLRRLSLTTFRQILNELPTDLFVESLPQSLPVLEALYAKMFLAGGKKFPNSLKNSVSPETVIWQLVKFFACQEDQGLASREGRWELCGPFINTCKRLLSVLLTAEPRLKRIVSERKKLLTKVIEGLGQHGMVGSADQSLMNLHDGLRIEFLRMKEQYHASITKLEELALSSKEPVTNCSAGVKAPVLSSHQRQLSLQISQVQERLIKNKTLLTVVEPAISCTSLEVLIGILQRRIELDKEVLFQFTTIKRETNLVNTNEKNPTIAPTLMKFQRGCHQVLELMKEVKEEEAASDEESTNSDISGYHSDSDSTVMMSGNSPFISKTARYNFLSRSVRLGSKHSARVSLIHTDEGLSSGSTSGFSSLPPSEISSPSTPSVSPPESSSQGDSDSNSSLDQEVDRKRRQRTNKKAPLGSININNMTSVNGWRDSIGNPASCPKCENVSIAREKLEADVEKLTGELSSTRQTIVRMHEREEKMKERLMDLKLREEQISISSASSVYLSTPGGRGKVGGENGLTNGAGNRREAARLVARYGELYSQARLDTLDALDEFKELASADELKNKLLFSVVVLSFRSVIASQATLRQQVASVLQIQPSNGDILQPEASHVKDFQKAIDEYLKKSVSNFKLDRNCNEVLNQICSTLFDYPMIRDCKELVNYIANCVSTAWGLSTQSPSYTIEYEERVFQSDIHVRFHTSDTSGTSVRTYIWPALREGKQGPVVHKAVVIT